ncbi:MAG TPA: hypothetical protein VIM16_09545 [Mucilaginibacter sp.]|jgi:uncharacterized membrane protein
MSEFDRYNPELWKWGTFYYNPQDPKLIVSRYDGLVILLTMLTGYLILLPAF